MKILKAIDYSSAYSRSPKSKIAEKWMNENNAVPIYLNAFEEQKSQIEFLETLIDGIRSEEIESGSYFLIDSFAGLENKNANDIFELFKTIIFNGVFIVDLKNGETFNEQNIGADELLEFVFSLIQDNELSKTRSEVAKKRWSDRESKIKSGFYKHIKLPSWIGSDNENKRYFLNDKSELIKNIFDLYLELGSINNVAKSLNERKIPVLKNASMWSYSSISWVLKQKQAIGCIVVGGVEIDDFFPPVIDSEKFYMVQEMMSKTVRTSGIVRASKEPNLLRAIAKCGCCGAPMHLQGQFRELSNGKLADYRYLLCSSNRNSEKKCDLGKFRYEAVEFVLSALLSNTSELAIDDKNKPLEKKLKKLIANIKDDKYRIELYSVLVDKITECYFNVDGSLSLLIAGEAATISGFKKMISIKSKNCTVTLSPKRA